MCAHINSQDEKNVLCLVWRCSIRWGKIGLDEGLVGAPLLLSIHGNNFFDLKTSIIILEKSVALAMLPDNRVSYIFWYVHQDMEKYTIESGCGIWPKEPQLHRNIPRLSYSSRSVHSECNSGPSRCSMQHVAQSQFTIIMTECNSGSSRYNMLLKASDTIIQAQIDATYNMLLVWIIMYSFQHCVACACCIILWTGCKISKVLAKECSSELNWH